MFSVVPVSLSTGMRGFQCDQYLDLFKHLHLSPAPNPRPLDFSKDPQVIFKFLQLGPHYTGSPDLHVQTCSPLGLNCQQANGWHLTEMLSCYSPPMKLWKVNVFSHVRVCPNWAGVPVQDPAPRYVQTCPT